jgi:cellulose synthase/poly-beta-1,6-N-acetylglucosamine synthase-like glycosyltransferase
MLFPLLIGLPLLLLFHSYAVYPWLMARLARGKRFDPGKCWPPDAAELPRISVLMAVYNEEKVLPRKIESVFRSHYPLEKIEFLIGSDCSTDRSHEIVRSWMDRWPGLRLRVFERRQGKPGILNTLSEEATGEIFVLTDANVFFGPDTLYHLAKHFRDPRIGQVGADFRHPEADPDGIGRQEGGYIRREAQLKYHEGLQWGVMMGAFGGCHAVRAEAFVHNPPHFIVEDFYLSLHVLASGYRAILEPAAQVEEDLPGIIQEEARRKTRIAVGNWQNLLAWRQLLWPPWRPLAFAWWSHKVLRWLGPFWLLWAWAASALWAVVGSPAGIGIFALLTLAYVGTPILDYLCRKLGQSIGLLRYGTYFLAMNWALLKGFFRFLQGGNSNVWQPTLRQ